MHFKPKTLLIIAFYLLLLLAASLSHARLGETPPECIARYGEPVLINKERQSLIFLKNGLEIIATFHEGKCETIAFNKAEEDPLGRSVEMSDEEVKVLLEANAAGQEWLSSKKISLEKEWSTPDRSLTAWVSLQSNQLIIATTAAVLRAAKKKAAQDKANLQGF